MALTVLSSVRFGQHLTPPGHPERPSRAEVLAGVAAECRARGIAVLEPREATNGELERIHDADYVAPGIRLALVPAQDRWLVELPQPAQAPGIAPTLRRFVPDSGADTLVLFGERRAGWLITAWRPGTSALGSVTGERAVRTATIDGLRVGEATLDRQIAAVVPSTAPDDPDGLLPLHLFASVFFSARSRALVIEAR